MKAADQTTNLEITSASDTATFAFGRKLGAQLQRGAVVALYGELGAGKTQLTKGIATALGIAADLVTSPTFTICTEHTDGRLPLYHYDVFRLGSVAEFDELGWEEKRDTGITVIEWAEKIAPRLPAKTIHITLSHTSDPATRRIQMRGTEFPT